MFATAAMRRTNGRQPSEGSGFTPEHLFARQNGEAERQAPKSQRHTSRLGTAGSRATSTPRVSASTMRRACDLTSRHALTKREASGGSARNRRLALRDGEPLEANFALTVSRSTGRQATLLASVQCCIDGAGDQGGGCV